MVSIACDTGILLRITSAVVCLDVFQIYHSGGYHRANPSTCQGGLISFSQNPPEVIPGRFGVVLLGEWIYGFLFLTCYHYTTMLRCKLEQAVENECMDEWIDGGI